ncbi:MAG: hypothetical protein Q7T80_13305 [Methanoregula sp.]|nr:hypothetical protein [Methanoregula sp.]
MRKLLVIIFTGIVCAMLLAAGCTSPPAATPATPSATITAAPVATTAAAELNVTAVTTTAAPALAPASWNGTWNTSYSTKGSSDFIEMLTLTQTGSSVTGSYGHGNGTISAIVQDSKIAGTWDETDDTGVFAGFFVFEKAADDKSFKGLWVNSTDGKDALKNTTQYWNGVRV